MSTRITQLSLKGFKSFKNRTDIPFYPGLTAVVGTNGSGKSSILEAVTFVMGKRSSNLRAEKMTQLIYNGGSDGTPAEKAHVRLHLDNTTGVFDSFLEENGEDVEQDEITISRFIKQNGYSNYQFNGSNCKRALIDEILDAADLDVDGFNYVGQGEVTRIIKRSPRERRSMIDEVAGILPYEEKKQEALEELEEVEEQLDEQDLKLQMKQERLNNLKREKEKAEKYQELTAKKTTVEKAVLIKRRNRLQTEIEELDEKAAAASDEVDELEEEVESLDEEIEEKEDELEHIEDELYRERDLSQMKDVEELRSKIQIRKNEIENKQEQRKTLKQTIQDMENAGFESKSRVAKKIFKLKLAGVYGTVADLITVPGEYEVAMQTALGGRLNNIVVDTRDTARECIDYLKKQGSGRATFLPMDTLKIHGISNQAEKAHGMKGVIDYAINLIDFDQQYEKAFKHLLGDTLICQDLDAVRDIQGIRAVTLDGDILRRGGSITGGAKKNKGKKKGKSFNVQEKKEKVEELEREIRDLKKQVEEMEDLLETKKESVAMSESESEELVEQRKQLRQDIEELREERKEIQNQLIGKKGKTTKAESKRARYEAELDNVKDELDEYDEVTPDVLDEFDADTVDGLEKEKERIVRELNNLGLVNERAIEEFEEVKEEFHQFKERVDEIKEEKKAIQVMIEEIEEEKRKRFKNAFDTVNEAFSDIFTALFQGGEAYLALEDPEDIESGLVINAEPPDKEPHTIDALSGGEQTLTAIAFIFALHEYQPSPFYILDEIDAALDATNSEKIADLLMQYAEKYQLIMVSHNEETVRHADRAYGVSMQDGKSQIRSINLQENN